jgi:hypothetical protein
MKEPANGEVMCFVKSQGVAAPVSDWMVRVTGHPEIQAQGSCTVADPGNTAPTAVTAAPSPTKQEADRGGHMPSAGAI